MREKGKVYVAMSGGIDSSMAAALLKKEGYQPIGIFCHFWHPKRITGELFENTCCSRESQEMAQQVANILDIPFYSFDLSKEFKKIVVDYYLQEYQAGQTPNPCVVCNQEIKFGLLREKIKKLGGSKLATGHYVIKRGNRLYRGRDRSKDQSYFLWDLRREQIRDLLFPVGEYLKREINKMAKEMRLPNVERAESQGVCFFPRGQHAQFIKTYLKKDQNKPGDIVDKEGKVVGEHQGIGYYTIGQRYGFTVDPIKLGFKGEDPPPIYVIGLKPKKNQLVVGLDRDLYQDQFIVKDLNWIQRKPVKQGERSFEALVQIRHLQPPVKAEIELNGREARVKAKEKIRSIAPGQSAVFYQKEELLGGGIIV